MINYYYLMCDARKSRTMLTVFIHHHLNPGKLFLKLIDTALCLRRLFLNVIRLAFLPFIITRIFFLRFSRHFTTQNLELVKLLST